MSESEEGFTLGEFPFPIEQEIIGSDDLRITFSFQSPFYRDQEIEFRQAFIEWQKSAFGAEAISYVEDGYVFVGSSTVTIMMDIGNSVVEVVQEHLNKLISDIGTVGTLQKVAIEVA